MLLFSAVIREHRLFDNLLYNNLSNNCYNEKCKNIYVNNICNPKIVKPYQIVLQYLYSKHLTIFYVFFK